MSTQEQKRIIKFRAWDKDNNFMVTTKEIMSNQEEYFFDFDNFGVMHLVQLQRIDVDDEEKSAVNVNCEWMQFTGLVDKNGKEIYEGDMLQFTEIDEDSAFGAEETNIVEVKWVDETAQWRAVFKSGRRTELHFVTHIPTVVSCEVIGNIYENPDLLPKKDINS